MGRVLPLDKMTTSEKLSAMEELWDDLCRDAQSVPSPTWHEKILADRENRVAEGTAKFIDLHEAKEAVRKSTQ